MAVNTMSFCAEVTHGTTLLFTKNGQIKRPVRIKSFMNKKYPKTGNAL